MSAPVVLDFRFGMCPELTGARLRLLGTSVSSLFKEGPVEVSACRADGGVERLGCCSLAPPAATCRLGQLPVSQWYVTGGTPCTVAETPSVPAHLRLSLSTVSPLLGDGEGRDVASQRDPPECRRTTGSVSPPAHCCVAQPPVAHTRGHTLHCSSSPPHSVG